MNIFFFAGRIIYGGGEKVRNWLVKKLVQKGHHVIYASSKTDNTYKASLKKVGLDEVVTAVEYPFHIKKKRPIEYSKAIEKLYKDHQVDLLIIFGGSLVEQMIARKCGIKILLSERCEPASRPILSQILKQIQYKVADGYVFQTPEAAACYGKRASRIGTIIPNPIIDNLSDPQFDNLRKEVVSVGRLSPEKNHRGLIDAFSIFHKSHPDYKLKIYGSGPLKGELIKLTVNKGISEFVEIISGKTNITELIKGAELFVLNSNTEGMPNALIEAMSMGVLSISTDCPIYGPRMLVKHGVNAYLTPVGQVESLANMMNYAIDNKELGNEIRHNSIHIREELNEDNIFSRWEKYIERI